MPAVRRKAVSKAVVKSQGPEHGGEGSSRQTLTHGALEQARSDATRRYELNMMGLDKNTRQALEADNNTSTGPAPLDEADIDMENVQHSSNEQDEQEGPDKASGQDMAFTHALRDLVTSRSRHYTDSRTWQQRVHRTRENWEPLLPALASGYLKWKYKAVSAPSSSESRSPSPRPTSTSPADDGTSDFTIPVIDLYTLATTAYITRGADCNSPLEALILHGYIGNSPISPNIAISVKTLELFRRIRLRKASFSVEAFAKVICDLYSIRYRRRYRTVLSDAFDTYLAILRIVDQQVLEALGRSGPNWRVQNACPPCTYKLQDEPTSIYNRVLAFDGNNSMKRFYRLGSTHPRDLLPFLGSDYLIPPEYVDRFKDEVSSRRGPAVPLSHQRADDAEAWEDIEGGDDGLVGDDTDDCTRNWKAASSAEKKRMWGVFEETGIFVSACRHSLILWFSDMIRSGELAKHPLAHVNLALDVLEEKLLLGSDIGCALKKTIASSSLGSRFKSRGCNCCVNAFHGYSHNWACQKKNHPNVIKGLGLEDLETLERIFSASNAVASVTRYATVYRRRVYIDMFFRQWDEDKYLNLGTMLLANYRQALTIIANDSLALNDTLTTLGISTSDLDTWQDEEATFFSTLGQEPVWDVHAMAYVELLIALKAAGAQHSNRVGMFISSAPPEYQFVVSSLQAPQSSYSEELSRTRKAETERRVAAERYAQLQHDVVTMEVALGITTRWQPSDPEYIETIKYMSERAYQKALGKLQQLVIQRLFELNRLNLAGTGYKMRTHIAKSLQTRCRAIQNAVSAYNSAALALYPPRPTLDWSTASHYTFLEDFELLRDSRNDIRERPWATPVVRAAMKQAQRIDRAREEIVNCNVAVRRLLTHVLDETADLRKIARDLADEGSFIAGAVEEYRIRRTSANSHILSHIQQIHHLDGYTGSVSPGIRVGRSKAPYYNNEDTSLSDDENDAEHVEDCLEDEGEDAQEEYNQLFNFVSDMPLQSE